MFSTAVLRGVRINALRRRVWFKLSVWGRSIIDLIIKCIKGKVLSSVTKIVIKILNLVEDILLGVMEVGFEVARRYLGQALRWVYVKALSWLRDEAYILRLVISYICVWKLKDPQVGFWWFIISE